jgi:hypothetical protein
MMGITVEMRMVAVETFGWNALDFGWIGKDALLDYIEDNPIPDDHAYSKEDVIADLTEGWGLMTFPNGISEEMRIYLENLLIELM